MNAKGSKRYSIRTKLLTFNCLVIIGTLMLGGIVFIVSIFSIVGKYIDNDINFFLTETNQNLANEMSFLESVIYKIRDSEELMGFLNEDNIEIKNYIAYYEKGFEKALDINSEMNSLSTGLPLVEKVYLFNNKGEYIRSSYYAMLYSDIERSDGIVTEIKKRYINDNKEQLKNLRYYAGDEGKKYLVYTVYDDYMNNVGIVVFEVRMDTIDNIMEDMKIYRDSKWAIFEEDYNVVYGNNINNIEEFGSLFVEHRYKPYLGQVNSQEYKIYYQEISLGLSVISAIPQNQVTLLLKNSIKMYFIIIVIIMTMAILLLITVLYHYIKPLKEIAEKMKSVKNGAFKTKIPYYSSKEFYEISETFNDMTTHINHLINEVYERQLSIKELEVKFLQMQTNPHFMFNVLNMIALEAKMNNDDVVFEMISSFSQLLQAKIYKKDTEKIRIKQELEYVKYYLSLQSYRFGERLTYDVYIEDNSLEECFVPKLCMQLIVENAVIHGIEPLIENGKVEIRIYRKDNSLNIDIIDNGAGFQEEGEIVFPLRNRKSEKGHNHVGLNNTHNIIRLTYGEEYGISAYSKKGEKTIVRINIPVEFELQ